MKHKRLYEVLAALAVAAAILLLIILTAEPARAAELNDSCRLIGKFTVTTYADIQEDQEEFVGQTASGEAPAVGHTIAVDPEIIPLGTWVFIEGIGFRRAEDTGGLIKGYKIDLLVDSSGETYLDRHVWIVTGGRRT